MFRDARALDRSRTETSFRTAMTAYTQAAESWFDGTPGSIDARLARCQRLLHAARATVGRVSLADAGMYLHATEELTADRQALTELRHSLLTGAADHAEPMPGAHHEVAPLHDYRQHGLGDPDEWAACQTRAAAVSPGMAEGTGPSELPPGIAYDHPGGGSHDSQVYSNPANPDQHFLVKHPPPGADYLAKVDVAANQIQKASGLETPATFMTDVGRGPASAQYMYPGATDAFPSKKVNPESLSPEDLLTLQKHHALDWMIGNHDAHGGQFIRTSDGQLVGIDKGQAFKHFGQDRLDWDFHPNGYYNEKEPVHNTLYRNFAQGGRELNDPRQGELGQHIQALQDIPDEDYRAMLSPYAESAARAGGLAKNWTAQHGLTQQSIPPNDVEAFLDAAVARKNGLGAQMGDLHDRAVAQRMSGAKTARHAATARLASTDRRWVELESARFVAAHAGVDAQELATRAQHFAEVKTSTFTPERSDALCRAFVARVIDLGRSTASQPVTVRTAYREPDFDAQLMFL